MKMLLTLSAVWLVSAAAMAGTACVNEKGEDIGSQPELFIPLIQNSSSCYAAKELAEACAWGSSLDIQTAGAAYDVCERELVAQNPSSELQQLRTSMESTCTEKYKNEMGTIYRSMDAYCHLSAIEWILNIAFPN